MFKIIDENCVLLFAIEFKNGFLFFINKSIILYFLFQILVQQLYEYPNLLQLFAKVYSYFSKSLKKIVKNEKDLTNGQKPSSDISMFVLE